MSSQGKTTLHVMTYNIRCDTLFDGKNRWSCRKDRVINLIHHYVPDLLGVQEPLPSQMTDLITGLITYGSYGVGRNNGGDDGEFCGIFYRRDRFELCDKGTFWLSEAPDTPGTRGWDAACVRICSWVKVKDQHTGKVLFFFNTHFDHKGSRARAESADLILKRIEQIAGHSTPVILVGDFNSGPDSDAYHIMIMNSKLVDSKLSSELPHFGPHGSWSTFNVKSGVGDRIDYIFTTPLHFKILKHTHITDSDNEYYPSDHLPVLAEMICVDE